MQQQDLQMPQRMQQPEQQKRDFAKEDVVRRIQREYTSGKQFKANLDLYEICKQNENFYIGKHWEGLKVSAVKPMTYNFLRRIIGTAQALVVSDDIGFQITPYLSIEEHDQQGEIIEESLRALIERQKIKSLNRESLHDCAVFGDSAMYFWFDPELETGQDMKGDIRAEILMNTNIIFGNPYSREVQGQPYIILVRRRPLDVVKLEAQRNGVPDWENIQPECEYDYMGEDKDQSGNLVTELTRFWKVKGQDGSEKVHFMTICGEVVTKEDTQTEMSLYPLAYWSWIDRKNCMHGISPMTEVIPTQIAINQMMTYIHTFNRNLAFPKFVFDTQKFPNGWDSTPGKAIGVRGDVNQTYANVFGGISLPAGIVEIVQMMREMMQDCMGASDASLGNVKPDNTSAIIAAQKATSAPLELQKRKFEQFNEDCIRIMVDMMCAFYGLRYVVTEQEQIDPVTGAQNKEKVLSQMDFGQMQIGQLDINVDVGAASYWSELMQTTTLDNLFAKQIVTDPELFIESIPAVQMPNKSEILRAVAEQKKQAMQQAAQQMQMQAANMPMPQAAEPITGVQV